MDDPYIHGYYCNRYIRGSKTQSLDHAKATFNITTMPSIPLDVLLEILGYVRKADLPTLCRDNKIFCACSQDVLYRDIYGGAHVIRTLSQSTNLARQVRSLDTSCEYPELATALRNMSSLRSLYLYGISDDASILDGCTFKLDSFRCSFSLL